MARKGVGPTASQVQQLELLNAAMCQLVANIKWLSSRVDSGGGAGGVAATGIEGPRRAGTAAPDGARKVAVHSNDVRLRDVGDVSAAQAENLRGAGSAAANAPGGCVSGLE